MIPHGIHAESNATHSGFHGSSSRARTHARPTRPDPTRGSTSPRSLSALTTSERLQGRDRARASILFSPDAEEWFALLFGMERVQGRMAELEGGL